MTNPGDNICSECGDDFISEYHLNLHQKTCDGSGKGYTRKSDKKSESGDRDSSGQASGGDRDKDGDADQDAGGDDDGTREIEQDIEDEETEDPYGDAKCPLCGSMIDIPDSAGRHDCPECGRMLEWSEEEV